MGLFNTFEELKYISVPCVVRIKNERLRMLLAVMNIIVFVGCGFLFWNERLWEKHVKPEGTFSFWAIAEGDHAAGVKSDIQTAKFCDTSLNMEYDYWYDVAGQFSYTHLTCKAMRAKESGVKDESRLFVPTYVSESLMDSIAVPDLLADGDCKSECENVVQNGVQPAGTKYVVASDSLNPLGECVCEASSMQSHFIPGAEDVSIGFEYIGDVKYAGKRETFIQQNKDHNVLTIIKDYDGGVYRTVPPGGALVFGMRELLRMTHVDLEEELRATSPNQLAGAMRAYPTLRLTGVDLQLLMSCYNPGEKNHNADHDGPVCDVSVTAHPRWNSREGSVLGTGADGRGAGSIRKQYMHGMSVGFQMTGSFQHFNLQKILPFVPSVIVYMQVPHAIVMFIALSCLGPLSRVYYNSRFKTVDVNTIIYGAMSRGIQRSQSYDGFLQLQMPDEAGVPPTTLKISSVEAMLSTLFASSKILNRTEIRAMTLSFMEGLDTGKDGKVSRDEFIKYAGADEPCQMEDLALMHDADWPRSILQRMFDADLPKRMATLRRLQDKIGAEQETVAKISDSPNCPDKEDKADPQANLRVASTACQGRDDASGMLPGTPTSHVDTV
jgi:hypothetical protein